MYKGNGSSEHQGHSQYAKSYKDKEMLKLTEVRKRQFIVILI